MPGPTLGPYTAFPDVGRGSFDPIGRILYWVKSAANVGNSWNACLGGVGCTYPSACYTPGDPSCNPSLPPSSFNIVVSALDLATLALTDTTYGPFPFSWNASPDGSLLIGGGNLYVGGAAASGGYRWFMSPLGGPYAGPCPGVTSWGTLSNIFDDLWGGDYTVNIVPPAAYAFSAPVGFVHVGTDGSVWLFGGTAPIATVGTTDAAACATPTDVWVLSCGATTVLTQIAAGSVVTTYTLAITPASGLDLQYDADDNTLLFWVANVLYKWDIATATMVNSAAVTWLGSGPVNAGLIPNGLDLYDAITLAKSPLSGDYTNPTIPVYSGSVLFQHFYDPVEQYIMLKADDHNVWGASIEPYSGPRTVAPPERYKRLPLKMDFASCSFDQADRLLMYELYRACGLDPLNPFLVALLPFLSGALWQPPVTLTLTVWSESVDSAWNILKNAMALGDTTPKTICGRVLTIDSVNYPEWNGEWEIVKVAYTPFGGQAAQTYGSQSGGEVTGSGELISAPSQGSGMLVLTLRTYNPNVFFDTSMTPSWTDVPGPWADGSY